ncbi:hypothetical protein [Luteithermobacter gelatinilyticus]|uniref:hypothetical protein n=1 Tax=Luteithermobacter gelatinilyticus TaxID=2582913 RepID=UPI001106F438|nr:hypothetical protein [Luteithermobacter gelatinilyticus]|tara:strand:+ start:5275 stop:5499 length:225 start_codon:yes stop_codon:yes gene_type:complete
MLIIFTLLALALFIYLLVADTSKWMTRDKNLTLLQASLCCFCLGLALLLQLPLLILAFITVWMIVSFWHLTLVD